MTDKKPIYIPIPVEKELLPNDQQLGNMADKWAKLLPEGDNVRNAFIQGFKLAMRQIKPITSLSELPEEWKAEIREIAGGGVEVGVERGLRHYYDRTQEQINQIAKTEHLQKILP